MVTNLLLCLG